MSERKIKVWVGSCKGSARTVIGDNHLQVSAETFARWDGRGVVSSATLTIPAPKKRKVATKPRNRGGAKRARINK